MACQDTTDKNVAWDKESMEQLPTVGQ